MRQKNVLKVIEALRTYKREDVLGIIKELPSELAVLLTMGGVIEGPAFVKGALAILMYNKLEDEDRVLQELEDLVKLD